MKVNAMSVAAVAVAGLAVYAFFRPRPAQGTTSVLDQIYSMARTQRQDSGSAIPQNTEYLGWWASPMSSTIYGNGSLGD